MAVGIDAGVDLGDLAVGIDQESIPGGEFCDSEISQRYIGGSDFVIGIRQQFEIETFLGTELFVGIDAIEAHAQNDRIALGVFSLIDLEIVGFAGATGRLVFRIEVQHHPFAAVVAQTDWCAFLGRQRELGSVAAWRWCDGSRKQPGDEEDPNNHDDDDQHDSQHEKPPVQSGPILDQFAV